MQYIFGHAYISWPVPPFPWQVIQKADSHVMSWLVSSRKLMPRFIGPFSIVKVLSPVAVKLRLSNQLRRVHPVFHVSCIKPVIRIPTRPTHPPPALDEGSSIYRVRRLLDVRPRGQGPPVFGGLGGVRS